MAVAGLESSVLNFIGKPIVHSEGQHSKVVGDKKDCA